VAELKAKGGGRRGNKPSDARFCLFMWLDRNGNGEPTQQEFSDVRVELEARAKSIIAAGRFKYAWLGAWDDAANDWEEITKYSN
jgi:hypothetical protein